MLHRGRRESPRVVETKLSPLEARSDFKLVLKDFNRTVGIVQVTYGLAVNDRLGSARSQLVRLATRVEAGQDLLKPDGDEDKGFINTKRELEEIVSEMRGSWE